MFAVDNTLVSDAVLEAPFSCNLAACHGACCVQGDSGAPLEPEERSEVERVLPAVRKYLRPEALEVIEKEGVWESVGREKYATTCVDGAECVFVTYDGPVAKCAIEKAHREGRIDFPKPISCHLFPIRVERYGDIETLNYEQIDICEPARIFGSRCGVALPDFLREPLTRKFGAEWYEKFLRAVEARREALGVEVPR